MLEMRMLIMGVLRILPVCKLIAMPRINPASASHAYPLDLPLDLPDYHLIFPLLLPQHFNLVLKFLEEAGSIEIRVSLEQPILAFQPLEHAVVLLHF